MKLKYPLFAEEDGESGGSGGSDELAKLKSSLAAVKEERNSIRQQLNALKDKLDGIDLDEYKQLKQEARDKEASKLGLAAQVEDLKTRHVAALAEAHKERDKYKASLDKLQIDTAVKSAFLRNGGRTDSGNEGVGYEDLVLLAVRDRIQLKDGRLSVLDKYGVENPEYNLDSLMKDLSEKGATSACFAPKNNNSGGGMQESTKSGGANLGLDMRTKLMSMSSEDMIAYAKENNIPLDKPLGT